MMGDTQTVRRFSQDLVNAVHQVFERYGWKGDKWAILTWDSKRFSTSICLQGESDTTDTIREILDYLDASGADIPNEEAGDAAISR